MAKEKAARRPRGRPPTGVPPEPVLFVRAPQTLIDRIDAFLERLRASMPGAKLSRSDAVRTLIDRALVREEEAAAPGTRRRSP